MSAIGEKFEYAAKTVKSVAIHQNVDDRRVRCRPRQDPPVFVSINKLTFVETRPDDRGVETFRKLGDEDYPERDDQRREQPQETPESLIKLFDIITIIRSTMSGRVPSWAGRPRAPSESPSDLYRV